MLTTLRLVCKRLARGLEVIVYLTAWANPFQEPVGIDRIVVWSAIDEDKAMLNLS